MPPEVWHVPRPQGVCVCGQDRQISYMVRAMSPQDGFFVRLSFHPSLPGDNTGAMISTSHMCMCSAQGGPENTRPPRHIGP